MEEIRQNRDYNMFVKWRKCMKFVCSHVSSSPPDQTDQTHQAVAGGERGASVHQGAADAEGDDDQRPGLRGEGMFSVLCVFDISHHPLVAVPEFRPHEINHLNLRIQCCCCPTSAH